MFFGMASSLFLFSGLISAGPVRAAVLYDTLSTTSAGVESIGASGLGTPNNYGMGISFRTTAVDYVIDSVTIKLKSDSATSGNVTLSIYDTSGSGGTPGSIVGTPLGTIAVSSLTASLSDYTLSSLNLTLSPSSNYWLTATSLDITSGVVRGSVTADTTGVTSGSVGYSFKNGSWTGPYSTYYGRASITTASAAVPEPSTIMGAVAVGALAFVRLRKTRRA